MSDLPPNPKKRRLSEGDALGFEDDHTPCIATWPHNDDSPDIFILNGLLDLGIEIPDTRAVLEVIQEGLFRAGYSYAGEAIRTLLFRLGAGKKADEFRAALGMTEGQSGQELADKHGITRQTWHTNIQRKRRKMLGDQKTSDETPIGIENEHL